MEGMVLPHLVPLFYVHSIFQLPKTMSSILNSLYLTCIVNLPVLIFLCGGRHHLPDSWPSSHQVLLINLVLFTCFSKFMKPLTLWRILSVRPMWIRDLSTGLGFR